MVALTERSVTALVLLLIALALLSNTFGRQYADLGGAFSPMFFPQIVLFLWAGLAALNLGVEAMRRERTALPRVVRVTVIALGALAFLYAMPRLGFFLSAVAFSLVALAVLGVRRPLPVAAVSLGVPAALVALFNHALTLPLPTSPFAWWF
jgi:hypothetical protein